MSCRLVEASIRVADINRSITRCCITIPILARASARLSRRFRPLNQLMKKRTYGVICRVSSTLAFAYFASNCLGHGGCVDGTRALRKSSTRSRFRTNLHIREISSNSKSKTHKNADLPFCRRVRECWNASLCRYNPHIAARPRGSELYN